VNSGRPRLYWILIGLLLTAAAVAGYSFRYILNPPLADAPPESPPPVPAPTELIGELRPEFGLMDLNNRLRQISEWDGRPLLLNFWATWCAPCREEIPAFIAAREKFKVTGFEVVGIAIDRPEFVLEFARELSIPYPLLYGDQDATEIMQRYGNRAGTLPYSVFIDAQGRIRQIHNRGVLREPELSEIIAGLTSAQESSTNSEPK
jgi:peroxiredoxin